MSQPACVFPDTPAGQLRQLAICEARFDTLRARLDEDWKNYNDYFNTIDYAKKEGKAEGRAEEQLKLAKGFKEAGTPIAIIAQVTGLSIEEIENL